MTEPEQLSKAFLVEPTAPFNELSVEIAREGDRSAEGRQAQLEKRRRDCGRGAGLLVAAIDLHDRRPRESDG